MEMQGDLMAKILFVFVQFLMTELPWAHPFSFDRLIRMIHPTLPSQTALIGVMTLGSLLIPMKIKETTIAAFQLQATRQTGAPTFFAQLNPKKVPERDTWVACAR